MQEKDVSVESHDSHGQLDVLAERSICQMDIERFNAVYHFHTNKQIDYN